MEKKVRKNHALKSIPVLILHLQFHHFNSANHRRVDNTSVTNSAPLDLEKKAVQY